MPNNPSTVESTKERLLRNSTSSDEDECWIWKLKARKDGYAHTYYKDRTWLIHRLSYHIFVGPIPEGLEVDHTCKVQLCINPKHLEAVTPALNTQRSRNPYLYSLGVPELCANGHHQTPLTTYEGPYGYNRCVICRNEYFRKWQQSHKKKGGAM